MVTHFGADTVVSNAFNGFFLCHVIWALHQCGYFSDDGVSSELTVPLQPSETFRACLSVLEDAGLVEMSKGKRQLTELGRQVVSQRGFFVWAVGGYGNLLSALGESVSGSQYSAERNEAHVAAGSGLIDRALLRDEVAGYILSLAPKVIADLGCGDATRLCNLASRDKTILGFGIERSAAAVELAQKQIHRYDLSDRLSVLQGDCLEKSHVSLSKEVDCVMSFFLLHDLLFANGGNFDRIAYSLSINYPNAKTFVFADTARFGRHDPDSGIVPVFVRGFEIVHAMMGVPLRTIEEYHDVLQSQHLKLCDVVKLAVPSSYLFVCQRP